MALIKITNFKGRQPKISPKLLAKEQAQIATDCDLRTGQLRAIRDKNYIKDAGGTRVVDSNGDAVIDSSLDYLVTGMSGSFYKLGDSWISWGSSVDVSVVRSWISSSDTAYSDNMVYFTGSGVPQQTDEANATSGDEDTWPTTTWQLGVPAPALAPSAALQGDGTDGLVVRSAVYVYTYVNIFGQESAPSPPSTPVDVDEGETVHVANIVDPSGTNLDVPYVRVYRVVAGSADEDFQLLSNGDEDMDVVNEATGSVGFVDDQDTLDTDLLEILPTVGWDNPPDDLEGLTLGPNNVLAGFIGNTVFFSEPEFPGAWPSEYSRDFSWDVVGIGVVGEMWIILTKGRPYVVRGSHPENYTKDPLPYERPCKSKRSIVSTPYGVIYPSDDGLFGININGAGRLLTENIITKEQWQENDLINLLAYYHDDKYYAFFYGGTMGFVLDFTENVQWIDLDAVGPVYDGLVSGDELYILTLEDGDYKIYEWEKSSDKRTLKWRSKKFQFFNTTSLTCGQIIAEGEVTLKLYVDENDDPEHIETVTSDSVFRLPAGRYKIVEIYLEGTEDIDSVMLASTPRELFARR